MSLMEGVKHLQIPLQQIKMATNNFSDENLIARGGFGKVYIGQLTVSEQQTTVAVKRLDRTLGQGDREFLMEIQTLSCYQHENLISLESQENILVYEYAKHGSLDKYLSDNELSWVQRLRISVGAARGLSYLHNDVGPQHRVMHRDIKSSNILLNENFEAKISDFGLSKIGPSNVAFTFLVTSACGTLGYIDPQYIRTGILTKESDVYSFGVVLFEILSGRLALSDQYQDERRFLASLAQRYYEENRLDEIIHPNLINQMKVHSLNMFTMVAYQCLNENRSERPTMSWIVEKLEKALALQESNSIDLDGYEDVPEETHNGIDFDAYEDIPVETSGENVPPPVKTFEEMKLGNALNLNIRRCKYDKPTLIQRHAIPISLAGRDLMVCTQTSTGKKAAICFPIISGIMKGQRARGTRTVFPVALILSPTREVLCEIHVEAQKFAYETGVKVVMVYGGAPISEQLQELEKGVDILVATPRRLVDLLERARVSLQMIRYLVLDEAGLMLDMGLESLIRKIVERTDMPPRGARQTMMFSASYHRKIQRVASDFLSNYISLTIGRVDSSIEC